MTGQELQLIGIIIGLGGFALFILVLAIYCLITGESITAYNIQDISIVPLSDITSLEE